MSTEIHSCRSLLICSILRSRVKPFKTTSTVAPQSLPTRVAQDYCPHAVAPQSLPTRVAQDYCPHTVALNQDYCPHTVALNQDYCPHTVALPQHYCPHTVALQKPTNYSSTLQKPLTIQSTEPSRTMSGNYLSKQSF